MSITKRVWIERDPAYEEFRKQSAEETWRHISEFEFRVPLKRKSKLHYTSYWDPFWPGCLQRAADQLEFDTVIVNEGIFFRTREQRDAVVELAETIWDEKVASRNFGQR